MLRLFSGSGSSEIELIRPSLSNDQLAILKRNAERLLQEKGELESAATLVQFPFELWEGTNSFGDEFDVLLLKTSISKYLTFEAEHDSGQHKEKYRAIARAFETLRRYVRFIAVEIIEDAVEAGATEATEVEIPKLRSSAAMVERALSDALVLLRSANGPESAIDRMHTALHGHMKNICLAQDIAFENDSDITKLFKLLREKHPAFVALPSEGERFLRPLASILDSLNPIRNHRSMAHPTNSLLDRPEAMLTHNVIRTLLHYLDSKLAPTPGEML